MFLGSSHIYLLKSYVWCLETKRERSLKKNNRSVLPPLLSIKKVDDDYETWALWQAPEVLERIQDGGFAKQNPNGCLPRGRGFREANLKHVFFSAKVEILTHRIHVWYIHLHLVDFHAKCR